MRSCRQSRAIFGHIWPLTEPGSGSMWPRIRNAPAWRVVRALEHMPAGDAPTMPSAAPLLISPDCPALARCTVFALRLAASQLACPVAIHDVVPLVLYYPLGITLWVFAYCAFYPLGSPHTPLRLHPLGCPFLATENAENSARVGASENSENQPFPLISVHFRSWCPALASRRASMHGSTGALHVQCSCAGHVQCTCVARALPCARRC